MTTIALYRDDFYLSTAEAVVTAVHEDGAVELDQAPLAQAAAQRQQRRVEPRGAGKQQRDAAPGLGRVHQP